MTTDTIESKPATLKEAWARFRADNPKVRIRDAAAALGVSEAGLLATGCGENVTRLEGDWTQVIKDFPKLGRIMCLTRNEATVHERYGEFLKIDFFHGMGQVVGPDIDLRLFMNCWKFGFAVTDQTADGERQSLQFFDAQGTAVHKVFLQKESNYGAYGVLLNQFRAADQSPDVPVKAAPAAKPPLPDSEIDVAGFRQAWLELKDTHAFFQVLQKFKVAREQALRLAPEGHAAQLPVDCVRTLLEKAAAQELPIMVFIGSSGCIQIHTGPVKNIRMFGADWVNVLDDDFNMHLFQPLVASAWLVRKPTTDGVVTSVEVFDAAGGLIVQFFGKRKPGEPELPEWRALAAGLCGEEK